MCLIVAFVMFALGIQSLFQHQYIAGGLQFMIALGFAVLLARNILAVRNQKKGCTTSGCGSTDWFTYLLRKKEK